jgi:hypothetical protein
MDGPGTKPAKEVLSEERLKLLLEKHLKISIEGNALKLVYKPCECGEPDCVAPPNLMLFNCHRPPCP